MNNSTVDVYETLLIFFDIYIYVYCLSTYRNRPYEV